MAPLRRRGVPTKHLSHCDSPKRLCAQGPPVGVSPNFSSHIPPGRAPTPCWELWEGTGGGHLLLNLYPCGSANGLCGCLMVWGFFRRGRLKGLPRKCQSVLM